jgi:hypothetical protein
MVRSEMIAWPAVDDGDGLIWWELAPFGHLVSGDANLKIGRKIEMDGWDE